MGKLYSSKDISHVLNKLGFHIVAQKGSHGKFRNKDRKIVILPMNRKEIPMGTFRSILHQIGIDKESFAKLLNK